MAKAFREPVGGANRCGRHAEWTSERPNRCKVCEAVPLVQHRALRVGFGGTSPRYPQTRYRSGCRLASLCIVRMRLSAALFRTAEGVRRLRRTNKGGTAGSPSF